MDPASPGALQVLEADVPQRVGWKGRHEALACPRPSLEGLRRPGCGAASEHMSRSGTCGRLECPFNLHF